MPAMTGGWSGTYRGDDGRWYQGAPSEDEQLITDAVAETEREMLDSAFDRDPDERTGFDEDLEQIEGFDGDPLSHAEQWHTSLYGHDENNFDRPLQAAAENILTQDVEALRAERDLYAGSLAEITAGPQAREAQRQQFQNNLENQYNVITYGDDGGQRLMGAIAETREDLANHSMKAAHLEHGDDFVDAFNGLMDSGNQALAAQIMNSRDPGGALMNWHLGTPGASGGGNRGFMPSLNSGENSGYRGQPSRGGRSRGRQQDISEGARWGSAEVEDDIANSVWD